MATPIAKVLLSRHELSLRTGLSESTITRLKQNARIPFFQPGGKGARVLFPPDAIELAARANHEDTTEDHNIATKGLINMSPQARRRKSLPGPRPQWQTQPEGGSQ
jgi:hypothetical protein